MITGMADPSILGYKGAAAHQMGESKDYEHCDPAMHEQMMGDHQKMMNGNTPSSAMPMGSHKH
jgi:hypothetical protein